MYGTDSNAAGAVSDTAQQSRDAQVASLARDMVLTAISSGAGIPTGQRMRECVRAARTFYSEVDKATEVKKKEAAPSYDDEPSPDEGLIMDEYDGD